MLLFFFANDRRLGVIARSALFVPATAQHPL